MDPARACGYCEVALHTPASHKAGKAATVTGGQTKCFDSSKAEKVLLHEVMREGLPGR